MPIDEITLEDSESYAIAMALDHAKSLGISKLEIRTDSKLRPPDGAQAPNGIEVNFVSRHVVFIIRGVSFASRHVLS